MDQADLIAFSSDLEHGRRISGGFHQQFRNAVLHLPADGPADRTAAAAVAEGLSGNEPGRILIISEEDSAEAQVLILILEAD